MHKQCHCCHCIFTNWLKLCFRPRLLTWIQTGWRTWSVCSFFPSGIWSKWFRKSILKTFDSEWFKEFQRFDGFGRKSNGSFESSCQKDPVRMECDFFWYIIPRNRAVRSMPGFGKWFHGSHELQRRAVSFLQRFGMAALAQRSSSSGSCKHKGHWSLEISWLSGSLCSLCLCKKSG